MPEAKKSGFAVFQCRLSCFLARFCYLREFHLASDWWICRLEYWNSCDWLMVKEYGQVIKDEIKIKMWSRFCIKLSQFPKLMQQKSKTYQIRPLVRYPFCIIACRSNFKPNSGLITKNNQFSVFAPLTFFFGQTQIMNGQKENTVVVLSIHEQGIEILAAS